MPNVVQVYPSVALYYRSANDLCDKVNRLDESIELLITAMATQALEDDVLEYRLDDGQTRIKVIKRSVEQMTKSIKALEQLRNYYLKQLNGTGVVRLVDHESTRLLNSNTH